VKGALRTAVRTLLWILAPLAAGGLILVFAGSVVSPLLYGVSSPLYEDSAAPVISLEFIDVLVAGTSVSIAVAAFLLCCRAAKLPLARSFGAALIGLVAIVGWITAVNGANWPLVAAVLGAVLGGGVVLGVHRVLRQRSPAEARTR